MGKIRGGERRFGRTWFGVEFFLVLGLGFRVWGFGFLVSDIWFLVSGFWFLVSGFGFRVSGFGFLVRISDSEFRVLDSGFQVSGFGFQVWGLGYRGSPPAMRSSSVSDTCNMPYMPAPVPAARKENQSTRLVRKAGHFWLAHHF